MINTPTKPKELWFIEKDYSNSSVVIYPCEVVSDTAKQFKIKQKDRIAVVFKELVDRSPGFHGSAGCYFSSRQNALDIWKKHFQKQVDYATLVITNLIELDIQEKRKMKK